MDAVPTFQTKWEMQKHLLEVHGGTRSGGAAIFPCRECVTTTTTTTTTTPNTDGSAHATRNTSGENADCPTTIMAPAFGTLWELMKHKHECHDTTTKVDKQGTQAHVTSALPSAVPKVKPVKCTVCGEMVPSRNKLFQHLKRQHHDGESPGAVGVAGTGTKPGPLPDGGLHVLTDVELCNRVEVVQEDADWYMVVHKPQGLVTQGGQRSEPSLMRNCNALCTDPVLRLRDNRLPVTNGNHILSVVARDEKGALSAAGSSAAPSSAAAQSYRHKRHLQFRKARPCHRLDKGTGGLVCCGKNKNAARLISLSFESRLAKKRCVRVVCCVHRPSVQATC